MVTGASVTSFVCFAMAVIYKCKVLKNVEHHYVVIMLSVVILSARSLTKQHMIKPVLLQL